MGDTFYLDTSRMDAIIDKVQNIAKIMEETKQTYKDTIEKHTKNWEGKAKTEFDKVSAQLLRTLTDVSQSFFDIGEDLFKAATSYMDVDTQNAKAMDGVRNRY